MRISAINKLGNRGLGDQLFDANLRTGYTGTVDLASPISTSYATYTQRPLSADGTDTFCPRVVEKLLLVTDPKTREQHRQNAMAAYPWCPELAAMGVQYMEPVTQAPMPPQVNPPQHPLADKPRPATTSVKLANSIAITEARYRTRVSEGSVSPCSSAPLFNISPPKQSGIDLTNPLGTVIGWPWWFTPTLAIGVFLIFFSDKKR